MMNRSDREEGELSSSGEKDWPNDSAAVLSTWLDVESRNRKLMEEEKVESIGEQHFACRLCGTASFLIDELKSHLIGRQHRENRHEYDRCIYEDRLPMEIANVKSSVWFGQPFRCVVCNTKPFAMQALSSHLIGKRHQKHCKRLEIEQRIQKIDLFRERLEQQVADRRKEISQANEVDQKVDEGSLPGNDARFQNSNEPSKVLDEESLDKESSREEAVEGDDHLHERKRNSDAAFGSDIPVRGVQRIKRDRALDLSCDSPTESGDRLYEEEQSGHQVAGDEMPTKRIRTENLTPEEVADLENAARSIQRRIKREPDSDDQSGELNPKLNDVHHNDRLTQDRLSQEQHREQEREQRREPVLFDFNEGVGINQRRMKRENARESGQPNELEGELRSASGTKLVLVYDMEYVAPE